MKRLVNYFVTYIAVLYFPVYMQFYMFFAHNKVEFEGKINMLYFVAAFHLMPALIISVLVWTLYAYNKKAADIVHTFLISLSLILLANTVGYLGLNTAMWAAAVVAISIAVGTIAYLLRGFFAEFFMVAGYLIILYFPYFFYDIGIFMEYESFSIYESSTSATDATGDSTSSPVVIIIFDELSLPAILDDTGEISDEFPSFKKLREESIWFRNAATNYDETNYAMPSMLLGRLLNNEEATKINVNSKAFRSSPNLFNLAASKYRISILSSVINYCLGKIDFECFGTMDYLKLDALESSKIFFYKFLDTSNFLLCRFIRGNFKLKLYHRPAVIERNLEHFYSIIDNKSLEGRFIYFHFLLPHKPYVYDRNGVIVRKYDSVNFKTVELKKGNLDKIMRDYKEQIKYVDKILGETVRLLKANGNWDSTDLIITSDHGDTKDGTTRFRTFGKVNDEIARIPMFIKPSGLKRGETRDDYYQHINFLPTILDMMRIKLPPNLKSYSVLRERRFNLPYYTNSKSVWWRRETLNGKWEKADLPDEFTFN